MQVIITANASAAAAHAADIVERTLAELEAPVFGLATGSTPVALYQALIERHRHQGLSFAKLTTFNLDEYVGLPPEHPQSYRHFMQRELFDHVDIEPANTFLPDGMSDPLEAGNAYEALIEGHGGIDLQVLGIGRNGHIGFNEPTSSLGSRTRVKTLTRDTLEANARFFAPQEFQPSLALTMGIATILEARSILLIATGEAKAEAVARCVEGPLSALVPASALQLHPKVTVIVDQAAAGRLELRDYYEFAAAHQRELHQATPGEAP